MYQIFEGFCKLDFFPPYVKRKRYFFGYRISYPSYQRNENRKSTLDFFLFFQDEKEYEWLCQKYEATMANRSNEIADNEKKRLAEEMLKSQNFDNFLATKFSNVKRYGGEGAEAMMGFFVELLDNGNSKCE